MCAHRLPFPQHFLVRGRNSHYKSGSCTIGVERIFVSTASSWSVCWLPFCADLHWDWGKLFPTQHLVFYFQMEVWNVFSAS